ncbi:hypothetical protein CYMTET_24993 [Cymbomonas tetramitiformis]|uniref:Uncharacterized protein n=1 Tax=Cymbomonas tetramitiformis TaxID=36881 RepID=A0AAE0KZI5_9CHLO|nr:hypothetical protein CYMTET_24993 [Cymbomonas tetramitiformis]
MIALLKLTSLRRASFLVLILLLCLCPLGVYFIHKVREVLKRAEQIEKQVNQLSVRYAEVGHASAALKTREHTDAHPNAPSLQRLTPSQQPRKHTETQGQHRHRHGQQQQQKHQHQQRQQDHDKQLPPHHHHSPSSRQRGTEGRASQVDRNQEAARQEQTRLEQDSEAHGNSSVAAGAATEKTSGESTLAAMRERLGQCISSRGGGLTAVPMTEDECMLQLKFPKDTHNQWVYHKTGTTEPLAHLYNVCTYAHQYVNVKALTTVLTQEFIDTAPHAVGFLHKRSNRKHSGEELKGQLARGKLPSQPPFTPQQYARCAVVGSSGDLLHSKFGAEIDGHDMVMRINEAPTGKYSEDVGSKTTFRVLNNMGWQRGHAHLVESPKEVRAPSDAPSLQSTKAQQQASHPLVTGSLVATCTTGRLQQEGRFGVGVHQRRVVTRIVLMKGDLHKNFISQMAKSNPAYILHMPRALTGSAGGTGSIAMKFAVSVCQHVNIYGFATEPGYTQWTRYFSGQGAGHHPLRGRAFYQVLECLGVIDIRASKRHPVNDQERVGLEEMAQAVYMAGRPQALRCERHGAQASNSSARSTSQERFHRYVWDVNDPIDNQLCVATLGG